MARALPVLKTERMTLKNISLENTADIVAWRSDPDVYCYFLSPHPIKKDEHINWFKNRYLYDDNRCDWMAYDKNNNPIGVFGIRKSSDLSLEAEINYILAPNKKRMGYAKEAILQLVEYASQVWKVEFIFAEIHIDNLASIHFAENLGMKLASTNGKFCIFQMSTINCLKKHINIRYEND